MSTAGLSHWWSVRQFVAAVGNPLTAPLAPASTPNRLAAAPPAKTHAPATPVAAKAPPVAAAEPSPHQTTSQKDFYEALIAKMNSLQTQNRDLLDQLAETNRDLMKLEFRVDTHSESFRPAARQRGAAIHQPRGRTGRAAPARRAGAAPLL